MALTTAPSCWPGEPTSAVGSRASISISVRTDSVPAMKASLPDARSATVAASWGSVRPAVPISPTTARAEAATAAQRPARVTTRASSPYGMSRSPPGAIPYSVSWAGVIRPTDLRRRRQGLAAAVRCTPAHVP